MNWAIRVDDFLACLSPSFSRAVGILAMWEYSRIIAMVKETVDLNLESWFPTPILGTLGLRR
jgi:hypothetical protein